MFPPVRQEALGASPGPGATLASRSSLGSSPSPPPRVGEDAASTRARSVGAASLPAWVGGGRPQPLAFFADCSSATFPAMNRFGTRLMGATATPPPPPPKARSNENLDKIDMSLGEEPSRTELEWEEVWVEPSTAVCGGRGGWPQLSMEFSYGWAEPSGGRWGRGERFLESGSSPRASGVTSAGLCLRGRGALRAGRLGRQRSADPVSAPPQRVATARGWPRLFVRKTPRVSPQACARWALSWGEGRGRTEPSFLRKLFESPAGSVKSVVPEKSWLGVLCARACAWRRTEASRRPESWPFPTGSRRPGHRGAGALDRKKR